MTDELIRRYATDFPNRRLAILSIDPSRRRTGGALLGDRIRMNALKLGCFARSLATRSVGSELSAATSDAIRLCQATDFDAIIVETSGIGQGSSAIIDISDITLYVMTPEYGAQVNLKKSICSISDMVVLNKLTVAG